MKKRVTLIIVMLAFWAMAFSLYGMYQLERPIQLEEETVVTYGKGRPLSRFFMSLEKQEIVEDSRFVMLLAKVNGDA